jgi:hypothetical protein
VEENGQFLLQGSSSVMISGENAYGFCIITGGNISLNNSVWEIMGNAAAVAMYSSSTTDTSSTIQVNNSTLTSNRDGIAISGGITDLVFDHTTLTNDSGNMITVEENTVAGVLNMIAKNASRLSGIAAVDATGTSNLTLQNNTQWTMSGDSIVTGLTLDDGHILFSPPTESAFKTLTVHQDYTANNGSTILMNTTLDDGAVPDTTDRFVIEGNTDGTVALDIQNAGGSGALTTGDGIPIVQVRGASDAVFTLAHPVIAGPYEYHLAKIGNDWYLQSKQGSLSATAAIPALDSKGLLLLIGGLGALGFIARRRFF